MDCLFCKIAHHEIESDIIFEDDKVIAFSDVNPQAPTHKLVIPKQHIATLNDLTDNEHEIIGYLIHRASVLAKELGHGEAGYRLVVNCNAQGGQTVFHLHCHLLSGRQMTWPPG